MGFHRTLAKPPTPSLSPMIPNNARLLCLTAAAGTELAEASCGSAQRGGLFTRVACETLTAVYTPRAFILHAASLGQAFAHCPKFQTAATRRCLGSVSVPVCPVSLSARVPVRALVSRYLTNKLMGREPLCERQVPKDPYLSPQSHATSRTYAVLALR